MAQQLLHQKVWFQKKLWRTFGLLNLPTPSRCCGRVRVRKPILIIVEACHICIHKLIPSLVYDRGMMQVTHMIHAVAAVLMMSLFLLHIYLGTIGMRGAYQGMRTGYVDESWAREHHEHWYDDVKAGKIPAQRSKPLALGDAAAADTARA